MTAHIFLARHEGSVLASFGTGLSTEPLLALTELSFQFGVQSGACLEKEVFREIMGGSSPIFRLALTACTIRRIWVVK